MNITRLLGSLLLLPCLANAEIDLTERLFFTAEERSLLETQRRLQLPGNTHHLELSGKIKRHDVNQAHAHNYLWLNGALIPEKPGLPDLRPGERFDLTRGERQGRIALEAKKAAQP